MDTPTTPTAPSARAPGLQAPPSAASVTSAAGLTSQVSASSNLTQKTSVTTVTSMYSVTSRRQLYQIEVEREDKPSSESRAMRRAVLVGGVLVAAVLIACVAMFVCVISPALRSTNTQSASEKADDTAHMNTTWSVHTYPHNV